jgi:hypothetical protein
LIHSHTTHTCTHGRKDQKGKATLPSWLRGIRLTISRGFPGSQRAHRLPRQRRGACRNEQPGPETLDRRWRFGAPSRPVGTGGGVVASSFRPLLGVLGFFLYSVPCSRVFSRSAAVIVGRQHVSFKGQSNTNDTRSDAGGCTGTRWQRTAAAWECCERLVSQLGRFIVTNPRVTKGYDLLLFSKVSG